MRPFMRYLVFIVPKKSKGGFADYKSNHARLDAAQKSGKKFNHYQIIDLHEGRIVEEQER